ncbi:hypothetical protein [Nocardioides guangzhouensis]|uniref:hypothetical protein n=1 Tax=Nocardioides guangzhouensis TaxID=2497878 RepID=UPI0024832730|nr:hypothetical protein [Nocardioides guangzhouensis]
MRRVLARGRVCCGHGTDPRRWGPRGRTTIGVGRDGDTLVVELTGKSGVDHVIEIDDALVLAAIDVLRRRRSRSDAALLAYREGRRWRRPEPAMVNEYVRQVTGLEVSAKDFRTWHATVLAAVALADADEAGDTAASRKGAVATAMSEVAA